MKRFSILFLLILTLLCVGAPIIMAGKKQTDSPSEADIRKAQYVYMEAAAAAVDGRYDDCVMLLSHAASLNPNDANIRGDLASYLIVLPTVDSAGTMNALEDLRIRFKSDPLQKSYADEYISYASRLRRRDDVIEAWRIIDSLSSDRSDTKLYLANELGRRGREGDIEEAKTILEGLAAVLPSDQTVAQHRISLANTQGDTAAMYRIMEDFYRAAPTNPENLVLLSLWHAGLEDADNSLRFLHLADSLSPDDGRVHMAGTQVAYALGDSVALDREVFAVLESANLEFEQKMELLVGYVANLYEDPHQRNRITTMFSKIQETNPGEAQVHFYYGAYLEEIDSFSDAAEQFRYSVDLDPTVEQAWYELVKNLGFSDDNENVISVSSEAHRRFPSNYYFPMMSSLALMDLDRNEEALAQLDSALTIGTESNPVMSHIYTIKGDLLSKMDQLDSALVAYNNAIEFNAENMMALNNAAYFMALADRDLDRAEVYASLACGQEPENSTFLDTFAWVMFKKREYRRAKEYIDRTLSAFLNEISKQENGDNQDPELEIPVSIQEFDIDRDLTKIDSADVLEHAGDIYFMNGDHREAIRFWEAALRHDPDNELLRRKVSHRTYFFE